jgi:Lon protease-like protein
MNSNEGEGALVPMREAQAPLFPLTNFFLYPGSLVPLHIFEPRYRQLVSDLLDGSGRLVMGTVPDEHRLELPEAPPIYPVAGLGEIARHEKLPDGRFLIWVFGLARVRVREVASEQPYRRVAYLPLQEIPVLHWRRDELQQNLEAAVKERCKDIPELPEELAITCLTDILTQRLQLSSADAMRLYAEPDVEQRALAALELHAQRGG